MKWAVLLFVFVFSFPAFASYSIKAEIVTGDSSPVSGTVVVDAGGFATITFKDVTITVSPTVAKANVLKIQTEVDQRGEGAKRIISKPTVIARLNRTAEISELAEDGTLKYRIRLTPTVVED